MKAYELMVKEPVYCINEKIKFLYYIDVYIQFKLEVSTGSFVCKVLVPACSNTHALL